MPEFNENHRRRTLSTLRYLEQLLDDAERIMASAGTRAAFPKYVADVTPVRRKVVADHIARFRYALLEALPLLELGPRQPEISMRRAVGVQLISAEIALEELTGSAMRGYGPLSATAAATIEGVAADLGRRLQAIAAFLDQAPDRDLGSRLERLATTSDEATLVREIERVVSSHGLVELRPALTMLVERMEERRFEIAVFGRVSAGKSSLLNRVIGTGALPVGVTPITAVPIHVVFGPSERVTVHFAERPPVVGTLATLAEVATEAANPANERHVTRVMVELPSPRLESGVAFVDTPGLGSLAVGVEEALAYLPRCDLGVLLVDAASSLGADELIIVRALYQAGAQATVVLSKADLLTPEERERAVRHARQLLASECGIEVPVWPVSVVGATAALADEWFEEVVRPLGHTHEQAAAVAIRRKAGALRDATIAALRHRLERGRPQAAAADRGAALARAAALFAATTRRCATLASDLDAVPERALAAAATAAAAQPAAAACQRLAGEALGEALASSAAAIAGEVTATLAQLRNELEGALAVAAGGDGAAAAGELPRVAGLPAIDVGPLAGRFVLQPSWRLRLGGGARRRAIAAQMAAQLGDDARRLLQAHHQRLLAWCGQTIGELRRHFDARAEVLRIAAPAGAAEPAAASEGEVEGIQADLARLENWERSHEPPGAEAASAAVGRRAAGN